MNAAEFNTFRTACLTNDGDALIDVHGSIVGLLVAIERLSPIPPEETDKLIAELRASVPPPHRFEPLPNFKTRCVVCGKPTKHAWHGWLLSSTVNSESPDSEKKREEGK